MTAILNGSIVPYVGVGHPIEKTHLTPGSENGFEAIAISVFALYNQSMGRSRHPRAFVLMLDKPAEAAHGLFRRVEVDDVFPIGAEQVPMLNGIFRQHTRTDS